MRPVHVLGPLTSPACTVTASVRTAVNPAATFDRYRTFSIAEPWAAPAGYQQSERTTDVERRVRLLVTAALQNKGYVPAESDADIVIVVGSGRRHTSAHASSSIGPGWAPADASVDREEGSLRVDAFESATRTRVWHGASRVEIPTSGIDQPLLERSVEGLLASFPRSSAGSGS